MQAAIDEAREGSISGAGGPFGACIVNIGNANIISVAHNTVVEENDPTAHAEINAIKLAAGKLGNYSLEGHAIFTTCEPCPMCLGGIYWARIDEVYFGCSRSDAKQIGFDDQFIYEEIALPMEMRKIKFLQGVQAKKCLEIFKVWENIENKKNY